LTEEENKENNREDNSGTEPEQKEAGFAQIIADKDTEIAALRKSETELKEKLAVAGKSLTEAVAGYKSRVLQMNPGITEELINGDTIEAVNLSLEKAISLVGRVRNQWKKKYRISKCRPARRADGHPIYRRSHRGKKFNTQ
jgi:hypothetical protein